MNVKRFTARTSREALTMVRQAFGDDAVVLSTKPCAEGVEVLAMAPESVAQLERVSAQPAPAAPPPRHTAATPAPRGGLSQRSASRAQERHEPLRRDTAAALPAPVPAAASAVQEDVEKLAMSTLSFQDYVRERMLRKREAELREQAAASVDSSFMAHETAPYAAEPAPLPAAPPAPVPSAASSRRSPQAAAAAALRLHGNVPQHPPQPAQPRPMPPSAALLQAAAQHHAALSPQAARPASPAPRREPPVLRDEVQLTSAPARPAVGGEIQVPVLAVPQALPRDQQDMMDELRSMKGLIEERFGALAFMEKMQRQPAQARLTQRLLDCGFSPALIRKLAESMPADVGDETAWAGGVLERNLITADTGPALEDQGGVYAMVGATGVGKTTTTAKIAAAFATKHGAANLGLITLDAYRVGAHEQLRAYGRILGVPVHTAHDRASLEDLLDLLSAKKMVLVDTAGMAQRDSRTRELLDMLSHRAINKLLVVNAAAQGETVEDVLLSYRASQARGVVLSKIDEAVKLGPALDAMIRHKLPVLGVANGQRVPEDWHRLSAHALVQRALRASAGSAWRVDANDVNLIFTARHPSPPAQAAHGPRA